MIISLYIYNSNVKNVDHIELYNVIRYTNFSILLLYRPLEIETYF